MTEASEKLPLKTKILYGFGSAAYGIKDNGFSVFLLFYYNQVIGMRADVVSLAIAIALFVDATHGYTGRRFRLRRRGCYYGIRPRPAPRCNFSIC